MRFAYADCPYLGCCGLYEHRHEPPWGCWDELDTHVRLIGSLAAFDAWALSLSTPSLRVLLPLCPPDARVGAWVKPFASFKPNVNPAYAWEPVIFHGGRSASERGGRDVATTRDFVSVPITLQRGLTGAKPERFCRWVFDMLGATPDDELVDLFPGSGAVTRAWERFCSERPFDFTRPLSLSETPQ